MSTATRALRQKFFTAAGPEGDAIRVDREKNVIYGVSLCKVGEAKGHGVFLDQEFIEEVTKQTAAYTNGMKCRFGHPAMCNDALGTYVGRLMNARTEGEKSIADLHLDPAAFSSPNGDLGTNLLDLAEHSPDQFGMSIVFSPGDNYQIDDQGEKVIVDPYSWGEEDMASAPDPSKPVYETLKALHACDATDTPAANDGLFSQLSTAATLAEFLDHHPEVLQLAASKPELVDQFLTRYNQQLMSTSNKPKTTLGQKLTAAAKKALSFLGIAIAFTDATTVDGVMIRIGNAEDTEPAVGDKVDVIDADGKVTGPAPDGAHIINGGDYDGWILEVMAGAITAITKPEAQVPAEEGAEEVTPAAQLASQHAEIKRLNAMLSSTEIALTALKADYEALKRAPFGEHTHIHGEEQEFSGAASKPWEKMPWNQK